MHDMAGKSILPLLKDARVVNFPLLQLVAEANTGTIDAFKRQETVPLMKRPRQVLNAHLS
ncbi:hypothetical protein HDU91_003653, partial [Kappamyces sp. JEL0680]